MARIILALSHHPTRSNFVPNCLSKELAFEAISSDHGAGDIGSPTRVLVNWKWWFKATTIALAGRVMKGLAREISASQAKNKEREN